MKLVVFSLMTSLLFANPIQDEVDKVNARIDNVVDIILQSYTNLDNEFAIIDYQATRASRFFGQATAGAIATSSIDLGSVSKGETEVGVGAGVSSSYISTVYAGAVAVKHGITDKNAIIVKGWKSDGSSYSVGVGTTYKFGD